MNKNKNKQKMLQHNVFQRIFNKRRKGNASKNWKSLLRAIHREKEKKNETFMLPHTTIFFVFLLHFGLGYCSYFMRTLSLSLSLDVFFDSRSYYILLLPQLVTFSWKNIKVAWNHLIFKEIVQLKHFRIFHYQNRKKWPKYWIR